MNKLNITLAHPSFPSNDLCESVASILDENDSGAMSTLRGNKAYINTAFFTYSSDLHLYFLSRLYDEHSKNIEQNHSTAVAIWSIPEVWGTDLRGVQLFGTSELVPFSKLIEPLRIYNQRFPLFSNTVKHPEDFNKGVTESRIYVLKVDSLKLLDEPRFGRRNYLTLEVKR